MAQAEKNLNLIAKEMYISYGEVAGFKNYQGNPMPSWPELGGTIQEAWIAAATTAYNLSVGTE